MLFDDAFELEKLNEAYTKCLLIESAADELFSSDDLSQFEKFFGIKMNNLEFPEDLYELLGKKPEVQTKKSKKLSKEAKQLLCDIWIGTQEIAVAKFLKDNGISIKPKEIHADNDYYAYKQTKPGKIEFNINLTPELLSKIDPKNAPDDTNESVYGYEPYDSDQHYEFMKNDVEAEVENLEEWFKDSAEDLIYAINSFDSPYGAVALVQKKDIDKIIKLLKDSEWYYRYFADFIDNDWLSLGITTKNLDELFDEDVLEKYSNEGPLAVISLSFEDGDILDDEGKNRFNESIVEGPRSQQSMDKLMKGGKKKSKTVTLTHDKPKTKTKRHNKRGKDGRFLPKDSLGKKALKGAGKLAGKAALGAGKLAGKAALKGGKLAAKGLGKAAKAGAKGLGKAIQKGIDATGLTSYKVSDKVKNELFNSLNVKNVLPAEYTKSSATENAKNKNMLLSYLAKNILSSILTSSGTIKGGLINGKFLIKKVKGQPVIKGECTFV